MSEVCNIIFNTDAMASFGLQPAQIDGQRTFITGVEDTEDYGASTDLSLPTSFWASGTRWVELQDVQSVNAQPANGFVEPGGARLFSVFWRSTTPEWVFRLTSPAGATLIAETVVAGSLSDVVAIGIDGATGDCRAIINGVEINLAAGFTGGWADVNVSILATHSGLIGTSSSSITTVTSGLNYTTDFSGIIGENQDWCGNDIPLEPTDPSEEPINAVETGTLSNFKVYPELTHLGNVF